jgi:hypothetical protein
MGKLVLVERWIRQPRTFSAHASFPHSLARPCRVLPRYFVSTLSAAHLHEAAERAKTTPHENCDTSAHIRLHGTYRPTPVTLLLVEISATQRTFTFGELLGRKGLISQEASPSHHGDLGRTPAVERMRALDWLLRLNVTTNPSSPAILPLPAGRGVKVAVMLSSCCDGHHDEI